MAATPTPILSIVVPCYQVAPYLPRCLESILDQADDRVEVIAVDDASPDGSGAILDHYAARDPRLTAIHLPVNVGLGRARNAGLDRARGDYLWFVDSDDWLPAGTLSAVRARLAATAPDLLVLDHVEVHPDGRVVPSASGPLLRAVTGPVRVADRPELLRLSLATSACTKVTSRRLLTETHLRFPPGWYEDCAFTYPLMLAARRVDTLDRVGYCYRRRPVGAITASVSERHFEVFAQYRRMWAALDRLAPGTDTPRAELFRLMVDHLLVIAGNDRRLPPRLRREFFARVAAEYHARLPAGGYSTPGAVARLRHRLVRWRAYRLYAGLRLAWRAAGLVSGPVARPVGSERIAPIATEAGKSALG